MTNKDKRKKKSLCERSMELVVSIIKLSSLSFATLSLRTPNLVPTAASGHKADEMDVSATPQLRGRQVSPPAIGSKPPEQLMSELDHDIDIKASDYITRIRDKNINVLNNASKSFSPM
ncbi:hypothetical protein AB3S75_038838 [Citrus x aurantiifolia]